MKGHDISIGTLDISNIKGYDITIGTFRYIKSEGL